MPECGHRSVQIATVDFDPSLLARRLSLCGNTQRTEAGGTFQSIPGKKSLVPLSTLSMHAAQTPIMTGDYSKSLRLLGKKSSMKYEERDAAAYKPIYAQDEPKTSSDTDDASLTGKHFHNERHHRTYGKPMLVLAVVLGLAIYTSIVVSLTLGITKENRKYGTRFLYSPANEFITYERRVMEQFEIEASNVTYSGEPNPEVDKAWHDLFEHQNIGFSKEYMQELGREDEGVELPDGRYFGSMMVFHHLHCLKNIYHALHPGYYELDRLEGHEKAMFWEHTDHCLHMLKEAVMCQGDTTVLTMKWADYGPRPIGNLTSPHECVNWDRLMQWVIPNSVDVFADAVLVHPQFGPLFKDGKPSKEFVDNLNSTGKVNGIDHL